MTPSPAALFWLNHLGHCLCAEGEQVRSISVKLRIAALLIIW